MALITIYVVNRSSSKIKARACRVTNLQSTIERTHEGRNLELLFSNPGPPTKSPSRPEVCVKILFQLHYYFPRYGHHMAVMAIWKFGLKRLFPPPTFAFWEGFDPKNYFSSSRPSKGTSLGESASFKIVLSGLAVWITAVSEWVAS